MRWSNVKCFQIESQEILVKNSASEYIHRVEQRMKEEAERAQQCFDKRTETEIARVMQDELLKQHMRTIVDVS